jgi:hypothetical protein
MNKLLLTAIAATIAVGANAQYLMDQIGPDGSGQSTANINASQDFEASFDIYDCMVTDDFTVGSAANVTGVEAVMGIYNATPNWSAVTGFHVEIYSTGTAAATNLTGDVFSQLVPAGSATIDQSWVGGTFGISKITIIGLNVNLAAGTYWIGVSGAMDFTPNGQIGVATSTFGGGGANSLQSNPGGGFGIPGNQQTIPNDSAFRVSGQLVPEPGTFVAIGLGLAALVLRRRSK